MFDPVETCGNPEDADRQKALRLPVGRQITANHGFQPLSYILGVIAYFANCTLVPRHCQCRGISPCNCFPGGSIPRMPLYIRRRDALDASRSILVRYAGDRCGCGVEPDYVMCFELFPFDTEQSQAKPPSIRISNSRISGRVPFTANSATSD